VARRAEKIINSLRERLPQKELRGCEEDTIITTGFTVVGRIISETLSGKSDYFGEVQLRLPSLRQMRQTQIGEVRMDIDALRFGSGADQWMDTGITLRKSESLMITAAGTIDIYPMMPGQYMSTPKGYNNPGTGIRTAGSLVARIGEGGDSFYIGERYEGSGCEGRLFLRIIQSPWNNASTGAYQVRISRR
jgi:hypothetical protein